MSSLMKVAEVCCHDGQKFFCTSKEGLEKFIHNYRILESERIKKEYPKAQSLVEVKIVQMTKEELAEIPISNDSSKYWPN